MQRTGIFQEILNALADAIQPGAGNIRTYLLWYWQFFVFFQFLRTVYAWMWSGHILDRALASLARAALVHWALYNFPQLLQWTQEEFVQVGLLAGGSRLTVAQYLDPGAYINRGIEVMALLYSTMTASMGLTSIAMGIGYFGLWVAFMASFIVMALNVMAWQLELLLAGLAALVLLPTAAFQSWAWMCQGSLSLVLNLTFRFFVGAALTSLTFPVLERLTITSPVSFQSVLVSTAGGWFFAIAFWQVNKMASHFLAGMASMSAGTIISSAIGSALTAGAVVSGMAGVGAGAAAGTLGAARGAAGIVGAARGAGSALASGGGMSGAMSGARAGASAAMGSPLMSRVGSFAGSAGRVASSQGSQSLRSFANTARFVGSGGGDSPGIGIRR